VVQEVLPHGRALQEGAYLVENLNRHVSRSSASHAAAVPHTDTSGSNSTTKRQHSSADHLPCLRDATSSWYQTLIKLNKEIDLCIEDFSSMCLDESDPQGTDIVSAECCHHTACYTVPLKSKGDTEEDRAADRVVVSDALENDIVKLGDMEPQSLSAPSTRDRGSMKGSKIGLLGESGKVIKAAHEALQEVKDVHSSDELMHYEFCGPFWELTEVSDNSLPYGLHMSRGYSH
jgi:hypothetical protein